MKPEDRENQRYANEDFCTVSKEERLMLDLLKKTVSELGLPNNAVHVLDIGCGSGRISKNLQNLGYHVTGLDFSEEAVKKAVARGIDAKRANLDEGIPPPDATFHIVWAGDIVEHVFDPIGLLRESGRVLKPGGAMLITIPSDVGLVSRVKMLFGISHQEGMYMTSGFYKHHTFFTPRLIRFMLKKAGFNINDFLTVLILGRHRFLVPYLPSMLFNEMVIRAKKPTGL
ncbi:MAG: class I SAM-dependent methyltransferase [Candidatus Moraniibacteriota bacterium]|nr:MAG: class I SAM-dependent methyltransferase [Candidatus Moranbacteria bacterium]